MLINHKKLVSISFFIILLSVFIVSICISRVYALDNKIVLATCNWEPHFGEKLLNGGYVTEITKEAFKRAGYAAEVLFVPWKRAMDMAKTGQYDGLMAAYYSEDRARIFKLTDVIASEDICFFSKAGRNIKYESLNDLTQYTIGHVRGGSFSDEFDNAAYLKKAPAADDYRNIKKLMLNRIDLIISSKMLILHLINTEFPQWKGKLEIVGHPIQVSGMHNAISRKIPGHEKIVNDFNVELKKMKEDGTFQKIMKKYGF